MLLCERLLVLITAATCLVIVCFVSENEAKPGVCPKNPGLRKMECRKTGPHLCNSDVNCPGVLKCCGCPRLCARPTNIAIARREKPGNCPAFKFSRIPRRCKWMVTTDRCTHDHDCPNRQKCCPESRCGGKKCSIRIKRARGRKRFRNGETVV